jgi:hypothetical protein
MLKAPRPSRGLDGIAPGCDLIALNEMQMWRGASQMDYGRLYGHLAPDVFERLRRHRAVAHGVCNAGMTQEVL